MKTVKVKIWNGKYDAYADETGTVRVYDPVAGYFTTCHSLTPGQMRYVRARAKN
jgi:hypothetical protein